MELIKILSISVLDMGLVGCNIKGAKNEKSY